MSDIKPASRASKVTAAEAAKIDSEGLRGSIAPTLDGDAESFAKQDLSVLKFHGIYQQEDRAQRAARRAAGLGKSFRFMVRVAIPGGTMTAEQYLALDRLARDHGDDSLRLTTRQGIQFHGVGKGDLKASVRAINDTLLTTFAACGDIRRNVMACPAPLPGGARAELQATADRIAHDLEPKTRGYHDIWLDGEKLSQSQLRVTDDDSGSAPAGAETFYGADYLPRKFKIGLATEDDNCIDAYTQDCALVAIVRDDHILGYNLLVGGGLGMTHNRPDTVARIATPLGFIEPEQAVEAVRGVAALFRDHGNRQDRRHARLKYLIEDWGLERFRHQLEQELGWSLKAAVPLPPPHQHDHLGSHEQAEGGVFYGLWVENGRLRGLQLEGVRAIIERFRPGVRVTPMQSLLFTGLEEEQIPELESLLNRFELSQIKSLPQALRGSMACPALPTCGLALADAELALPHITRELASSLRSYGLEEVPLIVRMTGCPNGCARPYNADIAFVGRRPGVYNIYVGGGARGDRLADLWQVDVPEQELILSLSPLLEAFAEERRNDEGIGDFFQRFTSRSGPRKLLSGREQPVADHLAVVRQTAEAV